MKTKIKKWGNSFGVRLPMDLINKKSLFDGTPVEISEGKDRIIIKYFREEKKETLDDLISKIKPDNLHSEKEWGNVSGKEIW